MSENNTNGSDLTDVGAFWKKQKGGKTFLSGKVKIGNEEFTAFVFTNEKKQPNHPDYRLVISALSPELMPPAFPKKDGSTAQPEKTATKPAAPAQEVAEDDIPF